MRGTYGPDQPYTEMAARALKLWAKYERRWKRQFLHRTGVLWMASGRDDAFERGSVKALRAAKIRFQELSTAQMKKRWPQINFEGIEWGIFEPECGYLDARASCQAVVDAFVASPGRVPASHGVGRRAGEWTCARSRAVGRVAPQGRLLRLRLRAVAREAVSAGCRQSGASDQAGYFLLRHPCGRRSLRRRESASLGRSSWTLSLRHSRQRPARIQDRRRHARDRPSIRLMANAS